MNIKEKLFCIIHLIYWVWNLLWSTNI